MASARDAYSACCLPRFWGGCERGAFSRLSPPTLHASSSTHTATDRCASILGDPLGAGWYDHDWAQLPEIPALRGTTLGPGARVFDIGAHQGVVAMMLAREVGSSGHVLAVEPNPHNVSVAMKNRELNGMTSQIDILEAAVSDRSGTIVFSHGLDGQLDDGTGAGGRMLVASCTFDELAERLRHAGLRHDRCGRRRVQSADGRRRCSAVGRGFRRGSPRQLRTRKAGRIGREAAVVLSGRSIHGDGARRSTTHRFARLLRTIRSRETASSCWRPANR